MGIHYRSIALQMEHFFYGNNIKSKMQILNQFKKYFLTKKP